MSEKKSLEELFDMEFYTQLREETLHCRFHYAGYCYKKYYEPVRCYNEKNWFFSLLGKKGYVNQRMKDKNGEKK